MPRFDGSHCPSPAATAQHIPDSTWTRGPGKHRAAERSCAHRYIAHFRSVHRGAYFAQLRTTAVRKLLPDSWGFLCPVHTPDGAPCGLLSHLSAGCQVVAQPARDPDNLRTALSQVIQLLNHGYVAHSTWSIAALPAAHAGSCCARVAPAGWLLLTWRQPGPTDPACCSIVRSARSLPARPCLHQVCRLLCACAWGLSPPKWHNGVQGF